ncbi:MarR family winged helix-turn-helix transcriptional regulator [bacterium]|nr:MarR family winged helix-turn-helix transcriptional regulator [bacterium]
MGTHFKGPENEVRSLDAYIKLVRCTESLAASLERGLKAAGLTVSQFGVLEALYHLGSMHQNVLCEKLLKSGGNLTMVVDNLEKNGLVRRVRDSRDRRRILVKLTDKGDQKIREVFPAHKSAIVEKFNVLSDEEKQTLGALCKRLGTA